MTGNKSIVCLGIMVADVVGRPLRVVPDPGRLVLVDEMSLHTGGCAVNAATALARFGLPVEVIGKVGEDAFGDFIVHAMKFRGIGTSGVIRDSSTGTSATMVMVDPDGERRFVHYIGANARLTIDDIDIAIIRNASILHVAGSLVMPGIDGEPTAELLKVARESNITTFLDTVWDDTGRWLEILEPCMPYIDYFVPSLPEAKALTGQSQPEDAAKALLDMGVGTAAIKMSSEGCYVLSSGKDAVYMPAFQVEVIDATGAGDAFAAGFIAGIWQGWTLNQSARLANAVGALCVTGVGATGGISSLGETLEFMEKTSFRNNREG